MYFISSVNTAPAGEIKLAVQIDWGTARTAKPYIACAMKKLDRAYTVHEVPWKRAQAGTQEGFFMMVSSWRPRTVRAMPTRFFPSRS